MIDMVDIVVLNSINGNKVIKIEVDTERAETVVDLIKQTLKSYYEKVIVDWRKCEL
jgi:RIO-like serine/threonine protein kinase